MRSLSRNKRTMYYALRIDEKPNYDEYGNLTGEVTPTYGDPVEMECNVSATTGIDAVQAFGNFTEYTRSVCVSDTSCPMSEDSIVWFNAPIDKPHNYIVVRKADSKNGVLYALREVTVT